jgi:hypothetical protein
MNNEGNPTMNEPLHKQHQQTSGANPSKILTIHLSIHFGVFLQLQPFYLRISDVKINLLIKKQKMSKILTRLTDAENFNFFFLSNGWTFYLTKVPQDICERIIKGGCN